MLALKSLMLAVVFFLSCLDKRTNGFTNHDDVAALGDLYWSLNSAPQLRGWNSTSADPCGESWIGILCSGPLVSFLNLHGLNLSGHLGSHLSNLHHLRQFDISFNNIEGEIPCLPPNATLINLSQNILTENIPPSLSSMRSLRHLNLSRNLLSGPIGNVFTGLQNLIEMDLSHNSFSGDLPSSFTDLTNLTKLFLHNNEFTGSVVFLANLPLHDLNIQDNHFSGVIPERFQMIQNLWIGGNKFQTRGNYQPWPFPLDIVPVNQNISKPPATKSNAVENHPSIKKTEKKRKLGPGAIASIVGGSTLMASCALLVVAVRIKRSRLEKVSMYGEISEDSMHTPLPITGTETSSPILPVSSTDFNLREMPSTSYLRNERRSRRSFSTKHRFPPSAKHYTIYDLHAATRGFSEQNLLGVGSLGPVYIAELPDGQILAVKKINTVPLSLHEEEQFLDVIGKIARFKHPNIVMLIGYCIERGAHLLVFEYIRDLSLDDVLHSEGNKALSWGLRLRISLGIARALDYLHSAFSPPVAHGNLKAANVLLDEEFMPRLCDCGLTILRPLSSNSAKLKTAELALVASGYIMPERDRPGFDNIKGDVFSFGVLLLELLTGRKPLDCSRHGEESLVKWASTRLHDKESLEQMLDSSIRNTLTSKSLSQFADIVSLCVQPQKEFRPSMSEVVESLTKMLQKPIIMEGSEDPLDRSFRSTYTRFMGSPASSWRSFEVADG